MDQRTHTADRLFLCLFLLLGGTLALATLKSCRGNLRKLTSEMALLVATQTHKRTPGLSTLPLHMT